MHNVEVWGEMGVGGGREERCRDRFLGRGKLGRDIMALCIMSKCGGNVCGKCGGGGFWEGESN